MRALTIGLLLLLPLGCARFGYEIVEPIDNTPRPGRPRCVDCDAGPIGSCSDGVRNQGETGIDCGGVCASCDAGSSASCSDGVQNQDETGSDCGGVCPSCSAGPIPSCSDTGTCDAGPSVSCSDAGACDAGPSVSCSVAGACDAGPSVSCSDGIHNQDETGIDCGGSCLPCPTSCTSVVADSAADFSGTQGQANWLYGYFQEPNFQSANFIPFSAFRFEPSVNEDGWFSSTGTWTWIGRLRMHPNGRYTSGSSTPIEQHAVRRWISPVNATLFVQGSIRTTNIGSEGVRGSISLGDDELWQQVTTPGQTGAFAFQLLVNVQVGDALNVALDPYLSRDGADDSEFFVQLCR
jgi:hypothetical protein